MVHFISKLPILSYFLVERRVYVRNSKFTFCLCNSVKNPLFSWFNILLAVFHEFLILLSGVSFFGSDTTSRSDLVLFGMDVFGDVSTAVRCSW